MPRTSNEPERLTHRLAQARRAWKRTAVLSGVVVVTSEAAGLVGLAVLADILFAPDRTGRIVLLSGAVAATAYLTARHILAPMWRKITDSQLALYLEEHNPQFEGSLIAAVEFGPQQQLSPRQLQIIQSIMHEAVARVERFNLRKAMDFRRFRKYGVVAVILLGAYVTLGFALPESVGKHVARVVAPWKPTQEELENRQKLAELNQPVTFALSHEDTRLLRGSAFDLEATLSRKTNDAVFFHFRAYDPKSQSATWKLLPMKQAERLNGYQFVLPDINEDLEFFVAAGEYKSQPHRISVYDPLMIQNTQLTIHYPEYLQHADETSQVPSPDVTALIGSTVTVRLDTNRPLQGGKITWQDGQTADAVADKTTPTTASYNFTVKADASYQYKLVDVDGQELQSPGALTVHAIADKPPTIKLLTPDPMLTVHPLGEIAFSADLNDDFGIASANLVYYRGLNPSAESTRIPLHLDGGKGSISLLLEGLSPQVQPGEMLTCYLECADRKGQKAVTELVLITITPFDTWSTWMPPHDHQVHEIVKLEAVLAATWQLHSQKDSLPPVDFNRQAEELADTMLDPQNKTLLPYVNLMDLTGESLVHAKRAISLIEQGHKALAGHATDNAIGFFRAALSELAAAGLKDITPVPPPPPNAANAIEKNLKDMDVKNETAAAAANAQAATAKPEQEKAAAQKTEDLQHQQENLVQKIKESQAQAQGKAGESKNQKDAKSEQAAKAQAAEQKALANKAQAAAEEMKAQAKANAKGTAEKLANAAHTMHEAAAALEKGQQDQGKQKAEEASRQLATIATELKGSSQDEIGRLLDQAERNAHQLQKEQAEIRQKTESITADLKGKAPDPRQQRDLKANTQQQVQLNNKVEQLGKTLEQLKDIGANGQLKAETAKQMDEANLHMKRNRVAQKAANAAVELAANHPDNAVPEQQKVEAGLAKVLEAVRAANDARATGHEAELKRAKGEADRIKEALTQASSKADQQAKKNAAAQALDEAQRLARHLQQRDLTKGDAQSEKDAKRLQELVAKAPNIQAQLEKDPKVSEFAQVTARLQDKLEKEYQSMLDAKKLFSSQREECPPEYRKLVNQYFEALSNQK